MLFRGCFGSPLIALAVVCLVDTGCARGAPAAPTAIAASVAAIWRDGADDPHAAWLDVVVSRSGNAVTVHLSSTGFPTAISPSTGPAILRIPLTAFGALIGAPVGGTGGVMLPVAGLVARGGSATTSFTALVSAIRASDPDARLDVFHATADTPAAGFAPRTVIDAVFDVCLTFAAAD